VLLIVVDGCVVGSGWDVQRDKEDETEDMHTTRLLASCAISKEKERRKSVGMICAD
jgi:hypothetical protein